MSSDNFVAELASALKENSFGLKEYQVIQETQLESIATVVLLEGDTITICLSPQGFTVRSYDMPVSCLRSIRHKKKKVSSKGSEVVHETLEQLLDSQSPAYRLASQQTLLSRLHGLTNTHVDEPGGTPADSTVNDE